MKKPELLAPAGDLERLKVAVDYGADAVYLGGPSLGLRANAKNFTFEEIEEGVLYAHKYGKRVFVTLNIVLHNQEINEVDETLDKLKKIGVDAIIVSDPAIMKKAIDKKIEVHVSTQQSTLNVEACRWWYEMGVKRVVLGREATIDEIKEIREKLPELEIECFIHGAMCAGVSGRCVLSNVFTNRDANRGGCAQICRWDFDLKNELDDTLEGEKPFTFCSKDLSMLEYLPTMIDLGITSFKIEGRMRSIYYIATILNVYRKVIDEYCCNKESYTYNKTYEHILRNCANRDSVVQFIDGRNDETMGYYNGREEVSNQDFLGVVLDYDKETKLALVEERNYFEKGYEIEVFGPKTDTYSQKISLILDEDGNEIDVVRHPKQIVQIKLEKEVFKNDLIRRKIV